MKLLLFLCLLSFNGFAAAEHDYQGSSAEQEAERANSASLIASQFIEDPYVGQDKMDLIVSGQFILSDVHIAANSNQVYGYFCDFSFDKQKKDPSLAPRYIDLYGESRHCQEHHVAVPLHQVATACRNHDLTTPQGEKKMMTSMDPTAFIFHQPKSGSTLLTNMIAASQPDTTRVIADSNALSAVLACQKCQSDLQIQALHDVMYMLGRTTTTTDEQHLLYVKLEPSNTVGLSVVREAFPETKWIFVYRDAPTILQKLVNSKVHRRTCGTKKRRNPGKAMTKYLSAQSKTIGSLETDEQVCAAVLATNMGIVVEELARDKNGFGRLVKFEDDLTSQADIQNLLEYLEVPSTDWERVEDQRKKRANTGQGQPWEGEVELEISHEVNSAAVEFELTNL